MSLKQIELIVPSKVVSLRHYRPTRSLGRVDPHPKYYVLECSPCVYNVVYGAELNYSISELSQFREVLMFLHPMGWIP